MADDRKDIDQPDGMSTDSLPRRLRDVIDYNNESAGRETGRQRRFTASSEDAGPEAEKKKEERQFNALLRLLQDPNYARLYQQATDVLTRADEAAERAMSKLTREGEVAAQRIQSLKDSAAEMPDGKKVFRSKDGRLITEDGKDVTAQKDSIKGLSPGTSSWEDFQRAKEIAEDIERRKRDIDTYRREVLEPARTRLTDTENPPAPEELEDWIKRMKSGQPADVRAELKGDLDGPPADLAVNPSASAPVAKAAIKSAASELDGETKLNAPDMFAQFRTASAVVKDDPYGSSPTPLPTSGIKPV